MIRECYEELEEKYSDPYRIQTALRSQYDDIDAELIAAVHTQCELQKKARNKLALHPDSLLTRTALEQASGKHAASYHTSLIRGKRVLEICSGIGSDAAAFVRECPRLVCIEKEETTAAYLRHNLHLLGHMNALVLHADAQDVLRSLNLNAFDVVFADPSRRDESKRTVRVEEYSPPLSFFKELSFSIPIIVKIAPGATVEDSHWKKIFLAVDHECKEQLLLHGFDCPSVRVADAESYSEWIPPALPPRNEGKALFLVEPHNAIIRSGEVASYLASINAWLVDPQIAYGLCENVPASSRWHTTFRILAMQTYNMKALRKAVQSFGFGPSLEIKKRGFPLLPENVRTNLTLNGRRKGVLILTRQKQRHLMIFCERV